MLITENFDIEGFGLPCGQRVIVCGSREGTADPFDVFNELEVIHVKHPIVEVIHGDYGEVDKMAGTWARARRIKETPVPANWDTYGKAAGPIRNKQMAEMKPDLVIAFPGGKGTANMIAIAKEKGIPVYEI